MNVRLKKIKRKRKAQGNKIMKIKKLRLLSNVIKLKDKNNLWYQIKDYKYEYNRTGNKTFKEKYQKLYIQYKAMGGKRKLG